jgi:F-type H+-transporting ATPase subunit epsilon
VAEKQLQVDLVSAEKKVWSGEADTVIARTTEGEIGVLPGHEPVLGQLSEGAVVRIRKDGDDLITAAVHGGFLSVTDKAVTVLAEVAELAEDIDTSRAREALERARQAGRDDQDALAAARRATSRLRAAGESP